VPELDAAGQRQHGEDGAGRGEPELDGDQDPSLRDPVGDHAAEQRGRDEPDRRAGGHERELTRLAAERDDLPDHGHQPEAVAEDVRGEGTDEQPVLAVLERPQRTAQPARGPRGRRRRRRRRGRRWRGLVGHAAVLPEVVR
jgi:hypothetical protein